MKKYLIFAPSYNENSGGAVVMHRLCHVLNGIGQQAFIFPHFDTHMISRLSLASDLYQAVKLEIRHLVRRFKTAQGWNTPVIRKASSLGDLNDWVVVYPEIVFGNPLNAPHVVRWLLHHPGFHSNSIFYGQGELYYRFNNAVENFNLSGSRMGSTDLKVVHYPLEFYNMQGVEKERAGTAYCRRKGKGRPIQHDLTNSVLIDGLSHSEVARVLKSVKTFISYDMYTAYSIFASLCGCDSVVVPDVDIDEDRWYPSMEDRYGIAYGFDKLDWARETRPKLLDHIEREIANSIESVESFVAETQEVFGGERTKKFHV